MKIKALEVFQDGNILASRIDVGQVVEVTLREYEMIVQSGGQFEVVPDETEVTPLPEEPRFTAPPLTEKELAAKQLKEKQELEARQKLESDKTAADALANEDVEVNLHPTLSGEAQATRAAEELTAKKVAEKQEAERQAEADKVAKEVASEVAKETKAPAPPLRASAGFRQGTQAAENKAAREKAERAG